mmetsp:Transcript_79451/g.228024  ORF Transcript_79451/g.228024 Transcript_79451/m.228024 type:complete len:347 (+) Transcript_79451:206-1246(+)
MQAIDALAAMALQLQAQQQLQAGAMSTAGYSGGATGTSASASAPGQLQVGVVRAWYEEKGFGFIAPDNGGQDVFIHRKQLGEGQSLVQGIQVTFELAMSSSSGKPAACRVTPIGNVGGMLAGATLPLMISSLGATGPAAAVALGKGIGKGGSEPSDNLFICGLPLDTSEERLRVVFGEYGIVQTMRLLPDVAGKPDKSALIRMGDVAQASWMVDNLNGNIPQGLVAPITVRFADNRAQKARELGLPKPGTAGAYGAAPRVNSLAPPRGSPYGTLDAGLAGFPAGDASNAANNSAMLFAALAQLQQVQGILPPAVNPGQSLQELLQDLQNLQGLTGPSAGGFGGFTT